MQLKILLVGPTINHSRPDTIGGTTVLFEEMIKYTNNMRNHSIIIVSSNYFANEILSFIYVVGKSIYSIKKVDIIFLNVSSTGVKILWPLFHVITILFKKRLILRVFGSHFEDDINSCYYSKYLRKLIPKLWMLLLETKHLVGKFECYNNRTFWFPNVRSAVLDQSHSNGKQKKSFSKKFIYLGQIKREKGILDLLDAFKKISGDYQLTIYGNILDASLDFLNNDGRYKGVLDPELVDSILSSNDVLILPTFYPGEGYPGVILEAYRSGLPVISTNFKSIPEIVKHGKTGLLVPTKDVDSLRNAILFFDIDKYDIFVENVKNFYVNFDSNVVHNDLFENKMHSVEF